jgi:hypothetical protein
MNPDKLCDGTEKLDAEFVFEQVGRKLTSEKASALWQRMRSEMRAGGAHRASSYLNDILLKDKNDRASKALDLFEGLVQL